MNWIDWMPKNYGKSQMQKSQFKIQPICRHAETNLQSWYHNHGWHKQQNKASFVQEIQWKTSDN